MALFASFPAMLALTLAASVVCTPPSILADAAVMAASNQVGLRGLGLSRRWGGGGLVG